MVTRAPTDPESDARALAFVHAQLPDAGASAARFLGTPDTKKNLVVRFRVGDESRVLKVYRHSARYALRLLMNPLSRWGTRAFTLRGTVPQRIASELRGIEGFQSAGLRTFEVLERPSANSLVYAFCPGRDLKSHIRRRLDAEQTRDVVAVVAAQLGNRQRLALERRDVRLVHPQPRLNHVWRTPDGGLLYFDFEDRVNPSLGLEEALGREVETFFRSLVRFEHTMAPEIVAAAAAALAGPPMERWREIAHRPRRFSGSARRAGGVFEAVQAAAGTDGRR